jgi:hypothetical protein
MPDESAAEVTEPRLGQGSFPAELDRVNWGAFWLSVLWGFFNGLWEWSLIVILLTWAVDAGAFNLTVMIAGVNALGWYFFFERLVLAVAGGVIALVAGLYGNRLVWRRESRRLQAPSGSVGTPKSVAPYQASQTDGLSYACR